MDRICRVFRARLWWCCLLCVLSVSAHSATRTTLPVSKQAVSDLARPASTSKSGPTLKVGGPPLEGEYIPSDFKPSKGTKLPAKVNYDYSIPRTLKKVGGKIRGGVIGIAVSVGIGMMLDEVGGFIEDNQAKKRICTLDGVELENCILPPADNSVNQYGVCNYFPASETIDKNKLFTYGTAKYVHTATYTPAAEMTASGWQLLNNCTDKSLGYEYKNGWPRSFKKLISDSSINYESVPLTDADFDTMEAFAGAQDSDFITGLLRDACQGSVSPSGCLSELRDNTAISGPSSVQGPSSTSTSTFTRPDGTTGTSSTVTNTNYNIAYGPNYYDYSKSTTKTTTTDGEVTSVETDVEAPDVTEETKPDDDEEDPQEAAPCSGDCSGPEYSDLYTPTEMTKEAELDSYSSRFLAIPIVTASASFFDVSVAGGGCPVWEYHKAMPLPGTAETFPIDLVFDYHCLPWFLAVQPFCAAVMLLGFTYLAYRVAIL